MHEAQANVGTHTGADDADDRGAGGGRPRSVLYTPENLTGHTRIYNAVDAAPGWRYGFVAYLTDGTRAYSDSSAAQEGAVSFDIPEETQYLYFVVLGAPESYQVHVWDNDASTDAQMPFEIRVEWRK